MKSHLDIERAREALRDYLKAQNVICTTEGGQTARTASKALTALSEALCIESSGNFLPQLSAGELLMAIIEHVKDTLVHKGWVFLFAAEFSGRLLWRAFVHDLSKLKPDEARGFAKISTLLKKVEYRSPAYNEALKSDCIQTHYHRNKHHPEHYGPIYNIPSDEEDSFHGGIFEMDLVDIVEMFMDWRAAVKRSPNGDLYKSVQTNEERFGAVSLREIFTNQVLRYRLDEKARKRNRRD